MVARHEPVQGREKMPKESLPLPTKSQRLAETACGKLACFSSASVCVLAVRGQRAGGADLFGKTVFYAKGNFTVRKIGFGAPLDFLFTVRHSLAGLQTGTSFANRGVFSLEHSMRARLLRQPE